MTTPRICKEKVYYAIDTFTMNGKKLKDVQAMGIVFNDDGTVEVEITMFKVKGPK